MDETCENVMNMSRVGSVTKSDIQFVLPKRVSMELMSFPICCQRVLFSVMPSVLWQSVSHSDKLTAHHLGAETHRRLKSLERSCSTQPGTWGFVTTGGSLPEMIPPTG